MTITDADRQLLAALVASAKPYTYGRSGGSPSDVAELDGIAARLRELSDQRVVEIVGAMADYTRPGNHYYAIRACLSRMGREALRSPGADATE